MEKVNNTSAYCTASWRWKEREEGREWMQFEKFFVLEEMQEKVHKTPKKRVGKFLMKFVTVLGIETCQWSLNFVAIYAIPLRVKTMPFFSSTLLSASCTILFTFLFSAEAISSIAWATTARQRVVVYVIYVILNKNSRRIDWNIENIP